MAKLEQAKWRCARCGEKEGLAVHHLSYDRLGEEASDDLIVLCRSCPWVADEVRSGVAIELLDKFYAPPRMTREQEKGEERRLFKMADGCMRKRSKRKPFEPEPHLEQGKSYRVARIKLRLGKLNKETRVERGVRNPRIGDIVKIPFNPNAVWGNGRWCRAYEQNHQYRAIFHIGHLEEISESRAS